MKFESLKGDKVLVEKLARKLCKSLGGSPDDPLFQVLADGREKVLFVQQWQAFKSEARSAIEIMIEHYEELKRQIN